MRILFFPFLASALIISCQHADKNESDKKNPETNTATSSGKSDPAAKLDGAWEIKRAEGDMKSMNPGTVYEFKDGKLTLEKNGFKNPGTTEVTDTTFSFLMESNKYKFMYNYKFNGDTLVASMQGSDQTFYMVKQ